MLYSTLYEVLKGGFPYGWHEHCIVTTAVFNLLWGIIIDIIYLDTIIKACVIERIMKTLPRSLMAFTCFAFCWFKKEKGQYFEEVVLCLFITC